MTLRTLTLTALMGVFLATPAFALDLQGARKSGLVGETRDGYVAVLKKSPEAQALVDDVNAKRRAEYERISKENGQPTAVVAKLAAEQIIGRLDAGSYYQDAAGKWQTR